MRLDLLELLAFGHFTGETLDFSQGKQGLHLVLGANEAGKSTALRSIRALLFGIENRTGDAFLHRPQDLRVGGRLRLANGDTIHFLRRKGLKNTLLSPQGDPLPESHLMPFLAGLTQETFQTVYSTSHEELRRGGELMVSGGGDLGQALFAASAGGADLKALEDLLSQEAATIFKPRGSKPVMSAALNAYHEALGQGRKEKSLKPEDWEAQRQKLTQARQEKEALTKAMAELRTTETKLERMGKIQALAAQRALVIEELEALAVRKLLPLEFPERRARAQADLRNGQVRHAQIEAEAEALGKKLAAIQLHRELLAASAQIENLYRDHGRQADYRAQLPELRARREELDRQIQSLAHRLGLGPSSIEPERYRVIVAAEAAIKDLAGQKNTLDQNQRALAERLMALEAEMAQEKAELGGIDYPEEKAERLERALSEVRTQGDLERRLAEVSNEVREMTARAGRILAGQPYWGGSMEKLAESPLPYEETVREHERILAELRGRKKTLEEKIGEESQRASSIREQIEALRAAGETPSPEEWQAARSRRDRGWSLVRSAWLENRADDEARRAYAADEPLDRAYEKDVWRADQVAERLWLESDRVARGQALKSQSENSRERLGSLRADMKALVHEEARAMDDWSSCWQGLGFEAGTPLEMLRWLDDCREVKRLAAEAEIRRNQASDMERRVREHSQALVESLVSLDRTAPVRETTLEELTRIAENRSGRLKADKERSRALAEAVDRKGRALKAAAAQSESLKQELARWREAWGKALAIANLHSELTPVEALAELEHLSRLGNLLDLAQSLDGQLNSWQGEQEKFERQVADLCGRANPGLASLPALEAIGELNRLAALARQDESNRKNLAERLEALVLDSGEALRQVETARVELGALCSLAGVERAEELAEAEETSKRLRDLAAQREQYDLQMLAHAAPDMGIDDLLREAAELSPDELPSRRDETRRSLKSMEEQRGLLEAAEAEAKVRLEKMDGGDQAAQTMDEARRHLAEAHRHAEDYLRLYLASSVLKLELERFRQKAQGPVLALAGGIFKGLTGGSFEGLATGFDSQDNPVLEGLRPGENSRTVSTAAMSDGARDQLYLALRLAALSRRLEEGEPFPLILDDALVHFDDERARNTFRELAGISQKTQVIFFTHHRHLAELAGDTLEQGTLFMHRLGE